MDFNDEIIDQIHELFVKLGYDHTNKLCYDLDKQKFDYKKIFDMFGLDNKFPEIVGDDVFKADKKRKMFSGNPCIGRYIDRFQHGNFKTREESINGTTDGIGFYFTECFGGAETYKFKRHSLPDEQIPTDDKRGIMVAKFKTGAKVIDANDLENISREKFKITRAVLDAGTWTCLGAPFSITPHDKAEKRAQIVGNSLWHFQPAHTLFALLSGHSAIEVGGLNYVVADRSDVIQPKNPDAELFK